jgi:hypothetical protein
MNRLSTLARGSVEAQRGSIGCSRLALIGLLFAYPLTSPAQQPAPNAPSAVQAAPGAVAPSPSMAGRYVRKGRPGDFLEFNVDGTCSGSQGGHAFRGTYTLKGDTIITTSPQFPGREDRARISGSTITDGDGIVWERPQDGAPAAHAAEAGGPSMKQLEKWIKRELPSMGDDHIITKSKDGTYGRTYRMPKAELDDCVLTIRQEFRFDDTESGQLRTTTIPLKDLDLAKLRTFEDAPSEGYTKNKPSYGVTLSALPETGTPFRVQTKGMGVDKTQSISRERVRVREQAMGLQLEGNLRRGAVLCGATDTPQAPLASAAPTSAPEKVVTATTGAASAGKSKKMTNADVIDLVNAGLSELVVANSIRQAPERDFDLSPQGLVALKKAKVSDSLIVAMQSAPVAQAAPPAPVPTKAPMYDPSLSTTYAAEKAAAAVAATGCTGIEAMGLYKNEIFDRAMGGGITEWIAKIRNNTAVTKIVVFSWRDQYGEEKASQVQIGGGQIASARVDMTEAKFIAPVKDLQLKRCQ